MFYVPAWQTAGFTTVSSIESLNDAARRGTAGGDKGDNREEVSGCVPVVVARFYECYDRRA